MKSILHLNGKTFKIESYKTEDELDCLGFLYIHDDLSEEDVDSFIDEFLVKNDIDINGLTDIEKIILLLKIREISIGDEIKVKYKCLHCGRPAEAVININNMIKLAKIHNGKIKGIFEEEYADILQLEDIVSPSDMEDMDLDLYEDVKNNISKYIDTYNFIQKCPCEYCGKENQFDFNKRLIINFISDESFDSLSRLLHILVYNGRQTRGDLMQMTPLQRILEYGLLEETKNEIDKRRKEIQSQAPNFG